MDDLRDFKTQLERICQISSWSPSNNELLLIRDDISKTIGPNGRLTNNDVERIVTRRVPDAIYAILEGVDNSDLKAQLLVALQATARK